MTLSPESAQGYILAEPVKNARDATYFLEIVCVENRNFFENLSFASPFAAFKIEDGTSAVIAGIMESDPMLGFKRRIAIVLTTIALFAGRFALGEDLASSLGSLPEPIRVSIMEAWQSIDRNPSIPSYLKEDTKQSAALYILQHPDVAWARDGKKAARDFLRKEYRYANRNSLYGHVGIDENAITSPSDDAMLPMVAEPNMSTKELGEVIGYGAYKYRSKLRPEEFIALYGSSYPEAAAIAKETYPEIMTRPDTYRARARRSIERASEHVPETPLSAVISDTYGSGYNSPSSTSSYHSSSSGSTSSSSSLSSYSSTRSDPIGDFLGGLLSSKWLLLMAFLVFRWLGGAGGSTCCSSRPSPSPYTPPSYTYSPSYAAYETAKVEQPMLASRRS